MSKKYLIAIAVLGLFVPSLAVGQSTPAPDPDDESTSNGQIWRNYTVRQSIEFGGRITENSGNQQMYDTLVNLQSGPRLLEQDLSMQSRKQPGTLFDNLYLSSFGLGGDPNDMVRLRIEKNKWYNFVGLYRRDQNFFDYNLFANPMTLNPGITNCSTVVSGAVASCVAAFNPTTNYFYTNSPHYQATTRNMGDFNLTLFPQSAVRVRLGFSINENKGTVDSSLEDVNIDLTEQAFTRSNRWSFGVDASPWKRTTISFDQFLEYVKVDTDYVPNPVNPFTLGVGGPGVSLPLYFPPCTVTVGGRPQPYITAPGVLNPLCNTGVFNYSRSDNVRSYFPTSQLSLRSNYFPKLDITASGTYSSGYSKLLNYNDLFYGAIGRAGTESAYSITGPASTDRVSGNADLGLTYHISRSWSVSDKFRWLNWRDPGALNTLENECYTNPVGGSLLAAFGAIGSPCNVPGVTAAPGVLATAGLTSVSAAAYTTLEGEQTFLNTATLNWAPSRRLSAYIGYRYGHRELTTFYSATTTNSPTTAVGTVGAPGTPTVSAGTIGLAGTSNPPTFPYFTATINQQTALGGVVVRPTDKWRINADAELTYADNAFTEISPRHEERVRASAVYKLNPWASFNAAVHIVEWRNDWAESFGGPSVNLFPAADAPAYGNQSHNRYYSLGATLGPYRKATLDIGWTYMDQKFNNPACMLVSNTVFGVNPAFGIDNPQPTGCPVTTNQPTLPATFNIQAQGGDTNVPVIQAYQENTNTAYAMLTLRPVHRLAVNLGYEITSTSGYTNWLRGDTGAPLQVLGDVFGNAPGIPGNPGTVVTGATTSTGTIAFPGPFPNQPLGSQDFNWHKATAGIAVDLCKGLTFKGSYAYYDYNEKEGNIPLTQLVALPRNFHTNVGTLSLRYAF